jgi:hypothetical protein
MKFDLMKVVSGIMTAVHVVEKIKGAKGPDKLDAVIESTPDIIGDIELNVGKDVLNDPSVVSAERNLISAYISFQNAVRDVQHGKGTMQPV